MLSSYILYFVFLQLQYTKVTKDEKKRKIEDYTGKEHFLISFKSCQAFEENYLCPLSSVPEELTPIERNCGLLRPKVNKHE